MARAIKKSAGMEYCSKVKELLEWHFMQYLGNDREL